MSPCIRELITIDRSIKTDYLLRYSFSKWSLYSMQKAPKFTILPYIIEFWSTMKLKVFVFSHIKLFLSFVLLTISQKTMVATCKTYLFYYCFAPQKVIKIEFIYVQRSHRPWLMKISQKIGPSRPIFMK